MDEQVNVVNIYDCLLLICKNDMTYIVCTFYFVSSLLPSLHGYIVYYCKCNIFQHKVCKLCIVYP